MHRRERSIPSTSYVTAGAAMVAIAMLCGCTGGLNRHDAPTGEDLPDLQARMPAAVPPTVTRGFERVPDRATWDKTVIVVETRQVEAQPTYVTAPTYDKTTARQRGDYPTVATVFEEHGDGGMMAIESVAAPFWSAWDLVVSPVRMCMRPPWATNRVPNNPPSLTPPAPTAAATTDDKPAAP
ncbi:MAG: hypothetical protein U0572_17430 [Phycisphaerales bacterium]